MRPANEARPAAAAGGLPVAGHHRVLGADGGRRAPQGGEEEEEEKLDLDAHGGSNTRRRVEFLPRPPRAGSCPLGPATKHAFPASEVLHVDGEIVEVAILRETPSPRGPARSPRSRCPGPWRGAWPGARPRRARRRPRRRARRWAARRTSTGRRAASR